MADSPGTNTRTKEHHYAIRAIPRATEEARAHYIPPVTNRTSVTRKDWPAQKVRYALKVNKELPQVRRNMLRTDI